MFGTVEYGMDGQAKRQLCRRKKRRGLSADSAFLRRTHCRDRAAERFENRANGNRVRRKQSAILRQSVSFLRVKIYKKLKVPVGLVHSSWGGSQIESWISKDGMLASDELKSYGQNMPKTWTEVDAMLERNVKKSTLGDADKNPAFGGREKISFG